MRPSVGRVVHYVSFGTPGGEYPRCCRAAVITEVNGTYERTAGRQHLTGPLEPAGEQIPPVSLAVLNPTGAFFNQNVPHDPGTTAGGGTRLCGGKQYRGGSWHWPEIVRDETAAKTLRPLPGLRDGEAA